MTTPKAAPKTSKLTYTALKSRQQQAVEAFPIVYAFSDAQLEKGLAKLGANKTEVVSVGNTGGLIRKADKAAFLDMMDSLDAEEQAAYQNDDFLISAIKYELGNHEYCITYDSTDTLDCLGLSLDDERTARLFSVARSMYLKEQEEWERKEQEEWERNKHHDPKDKTVTHFKHSKNKAGGYFITLYRFQKQNAQDTEERPQYKGPLGWSFHVNDKDHEVIPRLILIENMPAYTGDNLVDGVFQKNNMYAG
jgi:hypothetical protein